MKKWATFHLSLHFGSPNNVLSFKLFFLVQTNWFPSKMMPCKLNQNLICLDPEPLCKGVETNLKLLTNRNAWFHWTLLLGVLSKVALSLHVLCQTWFSLFFSQFYDTENMEKKFQKTSKITWIYTRKRKFSQFVPIFVWKQQQKWLENKSLMSTLVLKGWLCAGLFPYV